jgi:hypothetical protein
MASGRVPIIQQIEDIATTSMHTDTPTKNIGLKKPYAYKQHC